MKSNQYLRLHSTVIKYRFHEMNNIINEILKDAHNAIEEIYQQKENNFHNILLEIKEKYKGILQDDDFQVNQIIDETKTKTEPVKIPTSEVLEKHDENSTSSPICTPSPLCDRIQTRSSSARLKAPSISIHTNTSDEHTTDTDTNFSATKIQENAKKTKSSTNQSSIHTNVIDKDTIKTVANVCLTNVQEKTNIKKAWNDKNVAISKAPTRILKIPLPPCTQKGSNICSPIPSKRLYPDPKNSNRTVTLQKNEKSNVSSNDKPPPRLLRSRFKALQDKDVNTNLQPVQTKKADPTDKAAANKRKRSRSKLNVTPKKLPKYQIVTKIENEKEKKAQVIVEKSKVKPSNPKNMPKIEDKKSDTKEIQHNQIKNQRQTSELLEYNIDHIVGDASSDEEAAPRNPIPQWAKKEMREYPLKIQAWLNKEETTYAWFINENLKYPKLEELFSSSINMRPRTSSAVWNRKTQVFS